MNMTRLDAVARIVVCSQTIADFRNRKVRMLELISDDVDAKDIHIVTFGYDHRIDVIQKEINSLRKKFNIPTEAQARRQQRAAMNKLPQAVQAAMWGTYGKDGQGPLRNVRLIDCSSEHLGMILVQIAPTVGHPYISYISQILIARQSYSPFSDSMEYHESFA
jgi:hypothetical protein